MHPQRPLPLHRRLKRPLTRSFFAVRRRAQQSRPRRQSAAVLPSLAPHGVGRGCNMNRHAEDSWRSHVHRTSTAQRVQPFKPKTCNVGGRGERPSSDLLCIGSGAKRRMINAAPVGAATSRPLEGGKSKGSTDSDEHTDPVRQQRDDAARDDDAEEDDRHGAL